MLSAREVCARLALAAALLLVASGHGCEEEGGPLGSPVVAYGQLLENEDGSVEVALVLVGLSPPTALDGAGATRLQGPHEARLEAQGGGRYAGSASFEPGGHYAFAFEIDQELADRAHVFSGSFGLEIHAPFERPQLRVLPGSEITIEWTPSAPGLVELRDARGEVVYENFDLDDAANVRWSELTPGHHAIPPDAFTGPGPWTVRVCALAIVRTAPSPSPTPQHLDNAVQSSGLGWGSGAMAGRCSSLPLE